MKFPQRAARVRLSFLVLNRSTHEQKARSNTSLPLRAITYTCAAKEKARERVSENRFKEKMKNSAANIVGLVLFSSSAYLLFACAIQPILRYYYDADSSFATSLVLSDNNVLFAFLLSVPVTVFYAYWNWVSVKFLSHS